MKKNRQVYMTEIRTWIIDHIVGPIESQVLHSDMYQDILRDRALEIISDDITPQKSIIDIYGRFPTVFRRTAVREKLYKRMHSYCLGNYDDKAQEMFDDIRRDSPKAIPYVHELLCKTSALLFFNNKELYRTTDEDFVRMYKELTDEQKVEFAPKVLQTHGILLEEIPKSRRTKQLCVIAIHCHGYALRYVPEEYQLEMVCTAFITDGLQLRKEKWFEELFKQLTKKQQKECLTARKNKYRHWNQTISYST